MRGEPPAHPLAERTVMKWLLILVLPLLLAGCVTEQKQALPMALGPADNAQANEASCLRYGDSPTFGNCGAPASVSQDGK
jgi:hypothetical protein